MQPTDGHVGPPTFKYQCARFDEIQVVAETVQAHKLFFRKMQLTTRKAKALQGIGVDHDRVVCALAVKTLRSQKSVRLLGEASLAGDAMALARVALENAIVLIWILKGPATERLDTYSVAAAVTHQRWREVLKEYFPEDANVDAVKPHSDQAASISEEVFDDIHTTWAVFQNDKGKFVKTTAKEMFREANEQPEGSSSFAYDAPYFEGSAYVHSAPASAEAIVRALKPSRYFTLDVVPNDGLLRAQALMIANVAAVAALQALDSYCGGHFAADLHTVAIKLGASDT